MKLLIVESPGKVRKIGSFLGKEFKVMASVGHVRDLPKNEMGIKPPLFRLNYVETKPDVLERLAAAANLADEIYLATDPDREGEAIAWHLADALNIKEGRRVTYTEITESAIKSALAKFGKINMNLVKAQEGRRALDRLVGYMVSPVLSRQTGLRLSAGRVQSPAVRLVVDRERAIKKFKVTTHYGVELIFTGGWKAAWIPKIGWLEAGQEYILDKAVAERVAGIKTVTVLEFKESTSRQAPPPPFITSTLQQAASAALKFNPKMTMAIAQKLYENGHITYMRTDSPNLSQDAISQIRKWAESNGFSVPSRPRLWKSKDGAQEAHEAIRPTHVETDVAGDNDDEKKLYRMIRLRAIASQLEDAVFAVRSLTLEGDADGKAARFEARGRTLINPGWKALVETDQTDEDGEKEPDNPVPKMDSGNIDPEKTVLVTKKTKPPSRFTEAALIKELERLGIGRPSTYAAILDNITGRGYLKIEKRFLVPDQTGERVVDAMTGRFEFLNYDFTKKLEDELDEIADGNNNYENVISAAYKKLEDELDAFMRATSHKCPECNIGYLRHMIRKDSDGKPGFNFWGCSDYPECKTTFPDNDGQPDFEKKSAPPPSGFKCPECGGDLIRRQGVSKKTGNSYDFFSCSGEQCKKTFNATNDGQPEIK